MNYHNSNLRPLHIFITAFFVYVCIIFMQFAKHIEFDELTSSLNLVTFSGCLIIVAYCIHQLNINNFLRPMFITGLLLILCSMKISGSTRETYWLVLIIIYFTAGFYFSKETANHKLSFYLLFLLTSLQIIFGGFNVLGLEINHVVACIESGFFPLVKRCYVPINEPSYLAIALISLSLVQNGDKYKASILLLMIASLSLKSTLLYLAIPALLLSINLNFLFRGILVYGYVFFADFQLISHKLDFQLSLLSLKLKPFSEVDLALINFENFYIVYATIFLFLGFKKKVTIRRWRVTILAVIALLILKFDLTNSLFLTFVFGTIFSLWSKNPNFQRIIK